MGNEQIANLLSNVLTIMIVVLFALVAIWLMLKVKDNKRGKEAEEGKAKGKKKSKVEQVYNTQSIFDFMEFDKIEDNMIIQNDGKKFLMAIKCQGINYDLMSGVEKASVEQGFTQFLNTLRDPIQIYVQTRTVDLTGSINIYKDRVKSFGNNLTQKEYEYNQKVRSDRYEQEELDKEQFEVAKARNLYEYGLDIVSNTERMSLNKNILTKQYYIIFSHVPEEAFDDTYAGEEVRNIAFSELYTKAQSAISLLSVCGINSKILDSMELADLLYTAYNRDEAEVYDLKKAINAGYDNIYTTAPDVLEKKMKELDKQIELDAIEKANNAVYKVRNEQERERKLKKKERDFQRLVDNMAKIIIDENKELLGERAAERAKEIIDNQDDKSKEKKKDIENEGGKANEYEINETKKATTVRRTGRSRKTA